MNIEELVWSPKTLAKIEKKHRITPEEVEEIFEGDYHLRGFAGLYYAYGQSAAGRYIFVVLLPLRMGKAQVVTARGMTPKERRAYRRWKGG